MPLSEKEKMDRYYDKVMDERPQWRKDLEKDKGKVDWSDPHLVQVIAFAAILVLFAIGLGLYYLSKTPYKDHICYGCLLMTFVIIIGSGYIFYQLARRAKK